MTDHYTAVARAQQARPTPHLIGALAQTGDRVRNLTSGQIATVTGASQFGRILVDREPGKWERWNTEIIERSSEHGA